MRIRLGVGYYLDLGYCLVISLRNSSGNLTMFKRWPLPAWLANYFVRRERKRMAKAIERARREIDEAFNAAN